jgi:hypothetical protein
MLQIIGFLLLIVSSHCQIHLHLQLQDAPSMSQEKFASALKAADLSLAGEPLATLVKYDDQVIGIRSLPNECAAGYFLEGGKCAVCPCSVQPSSVGQVHFRPL